MTADLFMDFFFFFSQRLSFIGKTLVLKEIDLTQKIKPLINNIKNTNDISYRVNDPSKPNDVQWCIWHFSPFSPGVFETYLAWCEIQSLDHLQDQVFELSTAI